MTNEEYMHTQNTIVTIRTMLTTLDLSAFIAAINKAETVGPFIDPTLYRRGIGELQKVKRLAEAAQRLLACELPTYVEDGQ